MLFSLSDVKRLSTYGADAPAFESNQLAALTLQERLTSGSMAPWGFKFEVFGKVITIKSDVFPNHFVDGYLTYRCCLQIDTKVTMQVQGVFFRKHTAQRATALGLKGWVMNTNEGTVKGECIGQQPNCGACFLHLLK